MRAFYAYLDCHARIPRIWRGERAVSIETLITEKALRELENLVLDTMIFVVAVIIGQLTSYKLLIWKETLKICTRIFVIALILLAGAFK